MNNRKIRLARSREWLVGGSGILLVFAACRGFDDGARPSAGGEAGDGGSSSGVSSSDTSASGGQEDGASGEGGTAFPRVLGAPGPGVPLDPEVTEYYELGFYGTVGDGVLCPESSKLLYCNVFGRASSRPYVISAPAPCGTHGQLSEFAAFGVVYGSQWHNSVNDLYWQWGLDEKHDGMQGVSPWPAVWNGVLVAFELEEGLEDGRAVGRFTVDWEQRWWRSPEGVVEIRFAPEGLLADQPAYPIIGRWRREYGQRLGIYQAGKFYLDWDGDNLWDDALDRVATFSAPGTYPVAADFWRGGGDEIGLYADGIWYIDANQDYEYGGGDITHEIDVGEVTSTVPVVARDGWVHNCEE